MIRPLSHLFSRGEELADLCRRSREPILLTDDDGDLVLLHAKDCPSQQLKDRFFTAARLLQECRNEL